MECTDNSDLRDRTKPFRLAVVEWPCPAPLLHPSLADSSSSVPTSVGANYRAACRARSDFIAKLGIVEEECDESIYWMEMNTSGT